MRNNLLLIGVSVILGIVIGSSWKGCGNGDVVDRVEYKEVKVEVPVEKIVYLPGEIRDTTIYKTKYVKGDSIPGKVTYVFIHDTIKTSVTEQSFQYKDTNLTINGNAIITADTVYDFKLGEINIEYSKKEVTKVKKRTFGLYFGGGIGFGQGNIRAVNLGLDLAVKQRTLIGVSMEQPFAVEQNPIYWINVKRSLFK